MARKVIAVSGLVTVLGVVGLVIGFVVDPERTWLAYLMAFCVAFTAACGALFLLMTSYAANAKWMAVTRRAIETVASPLPLLALLFVPLLFGMSIYPWVHPHEDLEIYAHRAHYLNVPFFAIRGAVYLVVILLAAELLRRWSVRRPVVTLDDPLGRERSFSSGMLVAVGLVFSFAVIDWMMSLQGTWYSSMFPVTVFGGGFLAAIAATTIIVKVTKADVITRHHFRALGRMQFAFLVFWAYTAFFQALLIRIANKPEEVKFYAIRGGGWLVLQWILILGYFAVPFFVLLPKHIKYNGRAMAITGGWLVLMHIVDIYWLVVPARAGSVHWVDLAALAAVLGACVAFGAWRFARVPAIATNDPYLAEGARYRSPL